MSVIQIIVITRVLYRPNWKNPYTLRVRERRLISNIKRTRLRVYSTLR